MSGCYQYVMEGNKVVCDMSLSWSNPNTGGAIIVAAIFGGIALICYLISRRK